MSHILAFRYLQLSLYATHAADSTTTILIKEYYDDRDDESSIWYKDLFPDFESLPKNALPPLSRIGFKYTGQVVNPTFFLPWLSSELTRRGVRFIRRTIESLHQARVLLGTPVIVNASGLGAAELAQDEKVYAVRGQTMFVKSSFNHVVLFQGSEYTYVIPRTYSGGVILGGVSQSRSVSTAVDPHTKTDILRRVNQLTNGAFSWVDPERDVVKDIVGFRPYREGGIRVERDNDIIHAYGAGALGYLYCFGMAEKVRDLACEKMQHSKL